MIDAICLSVFIHRKEDALGAMINILDIAYKHNLEPEKGFEAVKAHRGPIPKTEAVPYFETIFAIEDRSYIWCCFYAKNEEIVEKAASDFDILMPNNRITSANTHIDWREKKSETVPLEHLAKWFGELIKGESTSK